jgi:hypothetical protein
MLLFVSTAAPATSLPIAARWSRDLLFHLAGVLTANVGLVLWITGLTVSLSLAITFFGLVVALGTLLACRWFARVERRRAAIVLGVPIAERYAPLPDTRWTTRLHTLIGDPTTWRDFAWTGLCGVIGMTLSGLAVTLWGCVLALVTLPAWYWSLPAEADVGVWAIDTLPRALAVAAVGLALVPLAGWIVRGLTVVELAWIPMRGSGESDAALASLATLRDDVIPATIGRVPGTNVDVSGDTAGSKDFNDAMKAHLPLVFGFVLGAAFLLLLVAFRSLVIPIKAIVLNLLSVGASSGVLTLVFQHGWGESLLGFEAGGGVTSWLPLFLFVVLFGLSMDYHVFIISRVREAVDRGIGTDAAVATRSSRRPAW